MSDDGFKSSYSGRCRCARYYYTVAEVRQHLYTGKRGSDLRLTEQHVSRRPE